MIPAKRESCPWPEADECNRTGFIVDFMAKVKFKTKLLPEYRNRYSRRWLHLVNL